MAIAVSIELGGSHATVAVVEDRAILSSHLLQIENSSLLETLFPKLSEVARDLLSSLGIASRDVLGVAFGIAALVDAKTNTVVATNGKYSDAVSLDLPRWSEESLGLPLALENDTRMGLLGEWYAGGAQGVRNVVMITLGTGVGCAVLVDGKPLRTGQPQGGCLGGHIPVQMNGRACSCGALGCMEAEASTWALPAILKEWHGIEHSSMAAGTHIGFKALFAHADAGDAVALAVRDHCIRVWAVGTVGLIHAYGPELILFGGGVMKSGDLVLDRVREYVDKYAWQPTHPAAIRAAVLGHNAALHGAIPLLQQGGKA